MIVPSVIYARLRTKAYYLYVECFFSKFPPQMVSRTGGEVGVLCDLSLPVLKVSLGGGGVWGGFS